MREIRRSCFSRCQSKLSCADWLASSALSTASSATWRARSAVNTTAVETEAAISAPLSRKIRLPSETAGPLAVGFVAFFGAIRPSELVEVRDVARARGVEADAERLGPRDLQRDANAAGPLVPDDDRSVAGGNPLEA